MAIGALNSQRTPSPLTCIAAVSGAGQCMLHEGQQTHLTVLLSSFLIHAWLRLGMRSASARRFATSSRSARDLPAPHIK
jgi:hypothetical protein